MKECRDTVTFYTATDGRRFFDPVECEKYENVVMSKKFDNEDVVKILDTNIFLFKKIPEFIELVLHEKISINIVQTVEEFETLIDHGVIPDNCDGVWDILHPNDIRRAEPPKYYQFPVILIGCRELSYPYISPSRELSVFDVFPELREDNFRNKFKIISKHQILCELPALQFLKEFSDAIYSRLEDVKK